MWRRVRTVLLCTFLSRYCEKRLKATPGELPKVSNHEHLERKLSLPNLLRIRSRPKRFWTLAVKTRSIRCSFAEVFFFILSLYFPIKQFLSRIVLPDPTGKTNITSYRIFCDIFTNFGANKCLSRIFYSTEINVCYFFLHFWAWPDVIVTHSELLKLYYSIPRRTIIIWKFNQNRLLIIIAKIDIARLITQKYD